MFGFDFRHVSLHFSIRKYICIMYIFMFVTYKEYLGSFTAYMYILNIDKYNIYIYIHMSM